MALTDFNSEGLAEIHAYWQRLSGDRPYPLISEINPADIVDQLPFFSILDVENAQTGTTQMRFRCRLEGTGIVALFGGDITGQFFDQIPPSPMLDGIINVFKTVVQTSEPALHHEEYFDTNDVAMYVERLIMPASTDGQSVDRLMTCLARYPARHTP